MSDSKQSNFKSGVFSSTYESINSSEHKNDAADKNNTIDKEATFSIFNEGVCGEPSRAQHLIIDFTPTEQDECEIAMKKCCDFFDYINSRPDLLQLKVKPDPGFVNNMDNSDSGPTISSVSSVEHEPPPTHMLDRSAVSVLEMVEKNDLIKRAFEPKMPQSKCSIGLDDYSVDDHGLKNFKEGSICSSVGYSSNKATDTGSSPVRSYEWFLYVFMFCIVNNII